MKQFEYTTLKQPRNAHLSAVTKALNEMGEKGWELVTHDYGAWFFKRELTEEVLAQRVNEAEARLAMYKHLVNEHDTVIIVGDVFKDHEDRFSDCTYRAEV